MTITVELRRVGRLVQAHVVQGGWSGGDLLAKAKLTDVENAKSECQRILGSRLEHFGPVHITFIDQSFGH